MRTTNIVKEAQSAREVSENAIEMSIDEGSTVFLMDALGKLYSRPAQAALREYISNAIDAHKAKGGNLPRIQVTLPASSNGLTHFSVRDFGNGMNEAEVANILSRYGASTKRDSNAMIGAFGFGAKSGFALSNEFFITSFQQTLRVRYRIFKDAQNKGYVEAVERTATNEPDGVLVEVPIPKANRSELSPISLIDANFFLGYGPDEIDVNMATGVSVASINAFAPLELGTETVGWLGRSKSNDKKLHALIGKVSYVINTDVLFSLMEETYGKDDSDFRNTLNALMCFNRSKVINIPIGSVDLPSHREEIAYSERTIKTLVPLISKFALLVKQNVQRELNQKATHADALRFLSALENARYQHFDELSWRGIVVSINMLRKSKLIHYTLSEMNRNGYRNLAHGSGSYLSDFSALLALQNKQKNKNGIYRLKVTSKDEFDEAKKLFSIDVLQRYLKSKNRLENKEKAVFLLYLEDDGISQWIFEGAAINVDELRSMSLQVEEEKRVQQEKERQAAREKELAKQAALREVRTKQEGLLSYFTLDSENDKPIRVSKEQVLTSSQPLYYWSKEEVFRFCKTSLNNLTNEHHILFPFKGQNAPNTYSVNSNWGANPPYNYMTKLRLFLSLFLPENSLMVILGREHKLAQFKADNPEVKSGVMALKDAVNADLENKFPRTVDAYRYITATESFPDVSTGQVWNPEPVRNLSNFASALTEDEAGKLDGSIGGIVERLSAIRKVIEKQQEWEQKVFLTFLNSFTDIDVRQCSQNLLTEIEPMSEKYPLLLQGTFPEYSGKVKQHLFHYMSMCDELT